jgi:quercetin dioxygenase-like cupin family protein
MRRMSWKQDDSFSLPANTIHWAKNVAKGPTKVLVTYIVEKGKPIVTPVKTAMK